MMIELTYARQYQIIVLNVIYPLLNKALMNQLGVHAPRNTSRLGQSLVACLALSAF
jgi:hypothetical protein